MRYNSIARIKGSSEMLQKKTIGRKGAMNCNCENNANASMTDT
jgi:hypothetical protein